MKLGIGLFAALLVAAAVTQSTLRVAYERDLTIKNAQTRNSNLAIAFESYAVRILDNAQTVARFIADQSQRTTRDGLAFAVRDRAANNKLLSAIAVFDARGDLVASSGQPAAGAVNISATDYFRAHAPDSADHVFVGKPSPSPVTGNMIVPLTCAIRSAQGQLAGVVLVEISPMRLTEFYREATISDGDVLSIVGFDGITRARRNGARYGAGEDVRASPMMQLRLAQPVGTYAGHGVVDGQFRHYSYRTLHDYPLLVIVGATEEEILLEHVQRRSRYYGNAALFSLICVVMAGILIFELLRRQRLMSELASREEKIRFVLESSRLGYWEQDLLTGKSNRSPLHDQLYGHAAPQGDWTIADMLGNVHADDRERVRQAFDRFMQDGVDTSAEFRVTWPDGSVHWLWSTARLNHDNAGRPVRISGVALDISERMAAQEQLARMNVVLEERVLERTRELEEANKELDAFANSVSHSLSAPLQVIDALSANLIDRLHARAEPEAQRLLDGIRRNAQNFSSLIEALLTSARASTQVMQPQHLDTVALVQDALGELVTERPKADYEIVVHPLPPAIGDRALVKQLWGALLSNALKFSSKRERPTIEVGGESTGGRATFFVRDNGAGFDMDKADKLFQVFQRLHNGADFPGPGVGLAIAHRIVVRHGGRIWAVSSEQQGATFYFTLTAS